MQEGQNNEGTPAKENYKGSHHKKGHRGTRSIAQFWGHYFAKINNRFHFVKMLLLLENILTNCWT